MTALCRLGPGPRPNPLAKSWSGAPRWPRGRRSLAPSPPYMGLGRARSPTSSAAGEPAAPTTGFVIRVRPLALLQQVRAFYYCLSI